MLPRKESKEFFYIHNIQETTGKGRLMRKEGAEFLIRTALGGADAHAWDCSVL